MKFQNAEDKPSGNPREVADLRFELANSGGRRLIIVRYGLQHSPLEEWVYNDADIDRSSVVWAREMNPTEDKNPSLTEYPLSNLK